MKTLHGGKRGPEAKFYAVQMQPLCHRISPHKNIGTSHSAVPGLGARELPGYLFSRIDEVSRTGMSAFILHVFQLFQIMITFQL